MTRLATTGLASGARQAENDVYTAMMMVAFLFVLAAALYVGYRALSLFGTLLPPGGG